MGSLPVTLLDTHALVWLTEGSSRLGSAARRLADAALGEDQLAVSAISFWEVGMLQRKGRVALQQPPETWRSKLLELGLREVPVDGNIGIAAATMTDIHPDPADRIIVATASLAAATLITADDRILAWPGALRTHDARV